MWLFQLLKCSLFRVLRYEKRCVYSVFGETKVYVLYIITHLEDIFHALSHFSEKEFNINSMFFMFKKYKKVKNKKSIK